jgi:hypothetical protein
MVSPDFKTGFNGGGLFGPAEAKSRGFPRYRTGRGTSLTDSIAVGGGNIQQAGNERNTWSCTGDFGQYPRPFVAFSSLGVGRPRRWQLE